jgi:cell division protein FtsQ
MDYNAPNTRERIAARRMARQSRPPEGGSQVRPDVRRSAQEWLASGRVAGLLLFVASMAALAYLFSDPRFSVQRATVEGAGALKPAQVIALSGLLGRPIWFAQPAAAERQLLGNAYIESAQVQIALPDRAIIRVVERRPEVRWQAGGVQYLVDGTGQVLSAAQEPATGDVLVITDNSNLELKPRDQLDRDALDLARTLALRLPGELGFTPAQIGWDFGLGVYVRSASNQTIIFGQSQQLDRKLNLLGALLNDHTAFTYLDLRPSNPFYQNARQPPATSTPAP